MLWDYNENELKKSDKVKIKLSEVKKYWKKLNLDSSRRKLFELLLWDN